jgi:hypothetical protein
MCHPTDPEAALVSFLHDSTQTRRRSKIIRTPEDKFFSDVFEKDLRNRQGSVV